MRCLYHRPEEEGRERSVVRRLQAPKDDRRRLSTTNRPDMTFAVDWALKTNHLSIFPLPRIRESFDALVGAQYYSTLDLASGYHQIATHPDDQHKTVFTTPIGLFQYTRMPMGLASAPATSQRLMQSTMSGFLFQFLLVYLDDLLVYSKAFDDHLEHLDRLLQRVIQTGLKLRMDKCQLRRSVA